MNRGTWKRHERWWADQLGGTRVPVTGRTRGYAPDVEHSTYAVEVKAGKVMSSRMQTAVDQAVASAEGTNKVPIVCITQTENVRGAMNDHYVLFRWEDFCRLLDEHALT